MLRPPQTSGFTHHIMVIDTEIWHAANSMTVIFCLPW
jgi:hypothetical protein